MTIEEREKQKRKLLKAIDEIKAERREKLKAELEDVEEYRKKLRGWELKLKERAEKKKADKDPRAESVYKSYQMIKSNRERVDSIIKSYQMQLKGGVIFTKDGDPSRRFVDDVEHKTMM